MNDDSEAKAYREGLSHGSPVMPNNQEKFAEDTPSPVAQMRVTDEMVDVAAQAYWMEVYGRHRKSQKWPDDVHGRSEELFRAGCRAALNAALATATEGSGE